MYVHDTLTSVVRFCVKTEIALVKACTHHTCRAHPILLRTASENKELFPTLLKNVRVLQDSVAPSTALVQTIRRVCTDINSKI